MATATTAIAIQGKPDYAPLAIDTARQEAASGDTVTVEGIVLGGVFANGNNGIRFNSFYVMDGSGSIAVSLTEAAWQSVHLHRGEKAALQGTWDIYEAAANSKSLTAATVLWHDSAANDLPEEIETKDFAWMIDYTVDSNDNRSGDVFLLDGIIKNFDTQNGILYYVFAPDETTFDSSDKTAAKNIFRANGADLSYLDSWLDVKVSFLMGIHDKKPDYDQNGNPVAVSGGYYRYDIIPGFFRTL